MNTKASFFDKKLMISAMIALACSAIVVAVIKGAESIHLPYIVAVLTAVSLGFIEPRKGWFLALLQCIFILADYFLFTDLPENKAQQELENFSLYGSLILTFVASFLGGFIKRAFNT